MIQLPAISVLATLGVDDASDPVRVDAYLADEIDDVVLETRASGGPRFGPSLIDVLARREDGSGGLLLKGMTTVPDGDLRAAYFFVPAPVAKQSLGQTPTPADLDARFIFSGRDLGDESAHADAPIPTPLCLCGHAGTPADPHAAGCEDGYAPEDRASLEPRIALDEPTDREKAITMLAFGDPKRLSDTRMYLGLLELAPNVVPYHAYHAMSADARAVFDARTRYEAGVRLNGAEIVHEDCRMMADNAALLEAGKPTAGEEAQRKAWAIARERGQLPNDPLWLAQKEHEHREACTGTRSAGTCHPEAARAADAIARAERAARLEAQLAEDDDDEVAGEAEHPTAAFAYTPHADDTCDGPPSSDSRYYRDSSPRRGRKMVAALLVGAGVGVIAAEIARRWSAR